MSLLFSSRLFYAFAGVGGKFFENQFSDNRRRPALPVGLNTPRTGGPDSPPTTISTPSLLPIRGFGILGGLITFIQLVDGPEARAARLKIINEVKNGKELDAAYQKLTTDHSTLSDKDLKDADDRLNRGVRTAQDYLMLSEIFKRKRNGADFGKLSDNERNIPNGFKDADQFSQVGNELKEALKKSGIAFSSVGVKGSAVTNIFS